MSVMVESCELTKSKKAYRVKLSGSYYNAFLDSGIETQIGKLIEAEIATSDKFGPYVKAWKPSATVNEAPQVPPPSVGSSTANPPAAAALYKYAEPAKLGNGDNVAPWYWPSVSNICAAAMSAGLIKNPTELNQWALKWAQVSVAVKSEVGS